MNQKTALPKSDQRAPKLRRLTLERVRFWGANGERFRQGERISMAFVESTFRQLHPSFRGAASPPTSWRIPICRFTLRRLSHLERQLFTSRVHLQRIALLDVPSQELLGQRILQVFLHGTAHRSSAVGWIVSPIDQKLDCVRIQLNPDILGAYPLDDFCHLEIHNLDQVVALEPVEDDYVIQPVQEFRFKHSF